MEQTQENMNIVNEEAGQSYFDGSTLGYIGWTLLGGLISSVTLGICFPWALCMLYEWKINHTVVQGRRLKFIGKPISLFGSWIKWLLLTIITFGIYGLFVYVALEKWIAKNTVFE